jgi:urease accessory protein
MFRIESILGSRSQPSISERLHRLEHAGTLDFVDIAVADLSRRRLLTQTRRGERLAIALPRDQKLYDGAVLFLDRERAIVVKARPEGWLRIQPATISDAIELGYHAGNLHWRVAFDGHVLMVALEGPPEDYLSRLEPLLTSGRIETAVLEAAPDSPYASASHGHGHQHSHAAGSDVHHHHDHVPDGSHGPNRGGHH